MPTTFIKTNQVVVLMQLLHIMYELLSISEQELTENLWKNAILTIFELHFSDFTTLNPSRSSLEKTKGFIDVTRPLLSGQPRMDESTNLKHKCM
jgi:hypothetical protein